MGVASVGWVMALRLFSRPGLARCLSVSTSASGDTALKPYSEIPGPRQLPFIGNGREMVANTSRFWMYLHEGFDKYGEIYKLNAFGKGEGDN